MDFKAGGFIFNRADNPGLLFIILNYNILYI